MLDLLEPPPDLPPLPPTDPPPPDLPPLPLEVELDPELPPDLPPFPEPPPDLPDLPEEDEAEVLELEPLPEGSSDVIAGLTQASAVASSEAADALLQVGSAGALLPLLKGHNS